MNYLLDTHIFLWMLADPQRLTSEAKKAIRHPHHSVFVSAVTAVEISIKKGLGKLDAPENLEEEIESRDQLVILMSREKTIRSTLFMVTFRVRLEK